MNGRGTEVISIVEYMRTLARRMVQDELSREAAFESLRDVTCNEADVITVAEEAQSLTHSEPELAFTLAWLGYEAATQTDSALGRALCAFRMATIHKARG